MKNTNYILLGFAFLSSTASFAQVPFENNFGPSMVIPPTEETERMRAQARAEKMKEEKDFLFYRSKKDVNDPIYEQMKNVEIGEAVSRDAEEILGAHPSVKEPFMALGHYLIPKFAIQEFRSNTATSTTVSRIDSSQWNAIKESIQKSINIYRRNLPKQDRKFSQLELEVATSLVSPIVFQLKDSILGEKLIEDGEKKNGRKRYYASTELLPYVFQEMYKRENGLSVAAHASKIIPILEENKSDLVQLRSEISDTPADTLNIPFDFMEIAIKNNMQLERSPFFEDIYRNYLRLLDASLNEGRLDVTSAGVLTVRGKGQLKDFSEHYKKVLITIASEQALAGKSNVDKRKLESLVHTMLDKASDRDRYVFLGRDTGITGMVQHSTELFREHVLKEILPQGNTSPFGSGGRTLPAGHR
ncbi:hypothetical protein GW915_13715 [bacterium]|nr:hypothetical protein [bacterium]